MKKNQINFHRFTLMKSKASKEITSLRRIGVEAAKQAIRSSKALGLSITYLKDGKVIEEFPDGTTKIIKEIEEVELPDVKLKKGMVFHARD